MSSTQDNQSVTIPSKRKYRKREFVGRGKARREVKARVLKGKQGDAMDLPVLNFWGIEGCGKSWLMQHLAQNYRGPGRLNKGQVKRTFTVLIDFADSDPFAWTTPNLEPLLKSAADDVIAQVGPSARTQEFPAEIESPTIDQVAPEQIVQSFARWVISLTERFVPLVLLDTIERLTPEALDHIERYLLEPLASTNKVVLVTAGRREVARWRRFAVRRRQAKPMELQAFTPQDTARQVKKQGFELPGELVYAYSFGLAYASQVIASAIKQISNGHQVDRDFVQRNEAQLGHWLAAFEVDLLKSIDSSLRKEIRQLCVLRTIRQGVAAWLLSLKDEDDFRQLLNDLEATRLVWWDPDQGTYLMSPPLRRLLNLRLRLEEPDVFAQRHKRAADYHREAVSKQPYDCGSLLIEALYHMAHGYADQLASRVDELLTKVLKPDNFTIGGVEFLLEQLRQDDELREALSIPLTEQVIQTVQDFHRKVRRLRLSAIPS